MPAITPLTSVPGAGPNDPTMQGKTVSIDLENTVEVFGAYNAGAAGQAYLLRWQPEANSGAGAWYEVGTDATSGGWAVDSTKHGGRFHARIAIADRYRGDFAVLIPAGGGVAECFIAGRRY